jgi:hypothetical protein
VTGTDRRQDRSPDNRPDGIKQQHQDSGPGPGPVSRRPPGYVVVISASDWVKEHFPAAGANLWDALHTGQDRHQGPGPDLEAEP